MTQPRPAAGCCGTPACTCAACAGLTALVRPRFFAGQVLTETDLMALERYAVEAHRLHNRYLHGPGVVCGLDLSCEECGDGVVISPGYALDPCGRDIVVPERQRVDVARLIGDCLAQQRGARDCDPPTPGPPKGCDDARHWCITLRHKEWTTRPVTPLAGSRSRAQKSCGCNGNGNGNGHDGCGCGCTEYVAPPDLPPGCEPTRIVECFEVGVHCCEGQCCTLAGTLEGTFPLRAAECVRALRPYLSRGIPARSQKAMVTSMLGQVDDADATRTGLCELHNTIVDLYTRDPLRTLCQLPPELQRVDCSEQQADETDVAYRDRLVLGSQTLMGLIAAYLRDCLCHAFNPPCPDPGDDRITLGCVTWRDGKVHDICNLQCRRYAGSFVTQRYWLPVMPAAVWVVGLLCCFPLAGGTLKGRVAMARAMDRLDPTGSTRRLLVQNDFAIPRTYRARARDLVRNLRLSELVDRYKPSPEAVNLAALEGASPADAGKALKQAKVSVDTVAVDSPQDVPPWRLATVPVAEPGTRLVQYVHEGRVVGYARAPKEG